MHRKKLRDQFAMQTIPALLDQGYGATPEMTSIAYGVADAMLKERDK